MTKLQSSGVSETSSTNEAIDESHSSTMMNIPANFEHFPDNSSTVSRFHQPTFSTRSPNGPCFLMAATSAHSPCEVTSGHSVNRPLQTPRDTTAASSASPENLSPRSASPLIRVHTTPGLQTTS
ncbi:unnamed protein product [Mesocestoides corti]|uniref:Uncharacterized protein n=1 Tax=Mesocestoides corti TaxID=53468 RepID=A0A0R3UCB8_MESCO|nr:unnamed protein product [Mesocestoides corti]